LACRKGRPRLSRREADADDVGEAADEEEPALYDDVEALVVPTELLGESFEFVRFPYLFFK